MRVASPVLQYRGGFLFFFIKITFSEICIDQQEQAFYNCSNTENGGKNVKTTYDKIVELLKKASEKQLRIIYQVVKTMLED